MRRLLLPAALSCAALSGAGALAHLLGAAPWTAGPAAALALASAALSAAWVLGVRRGLFAVEQALLSFSERDFATRLSLEDRPALANVGARFNALGEKLRAIEGQHYQRELLLETVLEATPSAVLLLDGARRVVFGNVAARALFFDGARVDGHGLEELLARAPAGLKEALAESREGIVTSPAAEGGESWAVALGRVELEYQPHLLVTVKPMGRELSRQEADAWKRAIRVISHELNNALAPLSSLVATARRIAGKPEHASRLEEAFDTIAGRTAALQRFLDGYAQFARLPQPRLQRVEWRPFLEGLKVLHPFVMPEALPDAAQADPAQLQQALVNLLKNAVESGSKLEEIRVTVSRSAEATVVEVSDRGQGMTAEQLAAAMVPFHSTKKSGTGLGLALCREIFEAHGGHLALRSAPGEGTSVRCVLPDSPG